MKKVVVIIEGGVVQSVIVNDENIDVVVIDYDVDGCDQDDIVTTHNGDDAYVHSGFPKDVDPDSVDKFFNL
jgi:hypothetical protein